MLSEQRSCYVLVAPEVCGLSDEGARRSSDRKKIRELLAEMQKAPGVDVLHELTTHIPAYRLKEVSAVVDELRTLDDMGTKQNIYFIVFTRSEKIAGAMEHCQNMKHVTVVHLAELLGNDRRSVSRLGVFPKISLLKCIATNLPKVIGRVLVNEDNQTSITPTGKLVYKNNIHQKRRTLVHQ